MRRTCVATITGVQPYSPSRMHGIMREKKESPDDWERRTWRERCHATPDGRVFVPPMAFKNCVAQAAKHLSIKIPGRGNAKYTKHFLSGVLVVDGLVLGVKKDEVDGEWLFLNPDGRRGGGTRVWKCYAKIDNWGGDVSFHLVDDIITQDIFEYVLREAGQFIGVGRFRPANGGYYGMFNVEAMNWTTSQLAEAAN